MWSGGVGSGSILEKIVGDGRCDWSGGILQEGMICGFGCGWNSWVYECESESLVVMFLHFCRRERERGTVCVKENIKREKKKRQTFGWEEIKKKHKKKERKEKLVLGWLTWQVEDMH